MIEVAPRLFVGNQPDYEKQVRKSKEPWAVVHACKEPYHRSIVGYETRGAPRNDPEYLWARRNERLALNIVDVNDHKFIAKEMIDTALAFIAEQLAAERKVLVHCNQGGSRGPSIALLYLAKHGYLKAASFEDAEAEFRDAYPAYQPAQGIRDFANMNWSAYHAPQ
jgi:rhodanese-related sulfurtransferase